MRAGYIEGIKMASYREDMPEPEINASNQVKIKVKSTGICGSEIPFDLIQVKKLRMVGSNMYVAEDFRMVCQAISDGKIDLSKFITQTYPIEAFKEAMELADSRKEPVMKVMLRF